MSTFAEVLGRPASAPDAVFRYGEQAGCVADFWVARAEAAPGRARTPLVIFLHGGFWRAAYDRAHAAPLATALAAAGYAVCVPEYRRTGQPGGGWPGTFDDVAAAVDGLPELVRRETAGAVRPGPVLLAGHSAGGHLALWAASRCMLPAGARWHARAPGLGGVIALAAVSDLAACHELDLGGGAAAELMGGGPDDHPDRYALADPARLVPAGVPARLVHGSADDRVPSSMSLAYAGRARAAGGDVRADILDGAGHFDLIDPMSEHWQAVAAAVAGLAAAVAPADLPSES